MSTRSEVAAYRGVLGEGHSATAMPCEVRLAASGLEVRGQDDARTRLWPYHHLRVSVPLTADAPDVLLSLQPSGAETLFVTNSAFARELLVRAPGLSPSHQRWHGMKPGLAVVGAVAALALGMWALDLHPAQAVARVMPQPAREAMGRNFVTAITKDHKACETPASRAALDRLTQRLTAAASSKAMHVRVQLLDWRLVNAFAAPGGQIV